MNVVCDYARDVGEDEAVFRAAEWLATDQFVALATVVHAWGSSPRQVGAMMVVRANGEFAGSVSGGCVEGAVIELAMGVLNCGEPRQIGFSVTDDEAWEIGLACGGSIRVYIERVDAVDMEPIVELIRRRGVGVRAIFLESGKSCLFQGDCESVGEWDGDASVLDLAANALRSNQCSIARIGDREVFLHVFKLSPRLILVGGVHIAQYLVPIATMAGFRVILLDPRRAFATKKRFPSTDLFFDWPDKGLQKLSLDAYSAVVTLTHDSKLDDAALRVALQSPSFYIGALGSKRTHDGRLQRLARIGFNENDLARIHGPVGLLLGGRSPAEIAIAIAAELTQVRYHAHSVDESLRPARVSAPSCSRRG